MDSYVIRTLQIAHSCLGFLRQNEFCFVQERGQGMLSLLVYLSGIGMVGEVASRNLERETETLDWGISPFIFPN